MEFPYGEIVKLPEGFAPPEMWPEFGALANPPNNWAREWVGDDPRGYRWSFWPFCFEQYFGDTEPDLEKSKNGSLARNRLIGWNRISRTDTSQGWRPLFSKNPWRVDGFSYLGTDYEKKWSHGARYDLRVWKKLVSLKKYAIENISLESFIAGYMNSTVMKKVGPIAFRRLARKFALKDPFVKPNLLGVRSKENGEIVAGMATYYSDKYKSSSYECPFASNEGKSARAIVGLLDYWFADSHRKGSKMQIFTAFWYPGKPDAWKGFSEFKSYFNLQYVAYPHELHRFVKGKLF